MTKSDQPSRFGIRGPMLHFVDSPFETAERNALEFFANGLLVISEGHVERMGRADDVIREFPTLEIREHYDQQHLVMPGFVDAHTHYSQSNIVGAYGEQLLDWLQKYTFPEEAKFANADYAVRVAEFAIDQLLSAGTTTAMAFPTVHTESVDALFSVAQKNRMRLISGKVMMDRSAPNAVLDSPELSYTESKQLIERWHNKPGTRLQYAITPRFAITSSPAQLEVAGALKQEFPDLHIQTHLSENTFEIQEVARLFPESAGYLDVYDRFGLLSAQTVFAHCVHLRADEVDRIAETGSSVAMCPSANLFLGSGLFDLRRATDAEISVGIGTDIGAGTSFSMLQTLGDAYKMLQLQNQSLSAAKGFYLATLGGAKALGIDKHIGNFAIGKEADFIVLDTHATPLLESRMADVNDVLEKLFVLMTVGDDRVIEDTYLLGQRY